VRIADVAFILYNEVAGRTEHGIGECGGKVNGCPIIDEGAKLIIDYLAKNYGLS